MAGSKIKGTGLQFDPEFCFLLALDPTFEEWQGLAAEWWTLTKRSPHAKLGLIAFFVTYLHGQSLDKSPRRLLDAGKQVPDLWAVLGLDSVSEAYAQQMHDWVSDFIDWVLREKFSAPDADGYRVVPAQWRNPFPRKGYKKHGKQGDLTFRHVLTIDPRMVAWVAYAAEYIQTVRENQGFRNRSVEAFLTRYLIAQDLPRDPLEFLKRTTTKPAFIDSLVNTKAKRWSAKGAANEKPSALLIKQNTHVADFIDWVLLKKLSVEGEHGERVVPAVFHNPIERLSVAGIGAPSETVKNALPMLYIRKLRKMLAEGRNFQDWTWAQVATDSAGPGGDWFVVDPTLVNRDDPDCAWRERRTGRRERKNNNLPEVLTEIWSPVRAVVLYVKLEVALRTHQVRFLDSGEGDTWRYVWDAQGGRFELNDTAFTLGSEARPCQRGVFHRDAGGQGPGFFINTNKTADINKPEDKKGYVIPWTNIELLYWLEKLRNWQERYNPVEAAMPWTELEARYFSARPAEAILAERSPAFFLFRNAAAEGRNRAKPVPDGALPTLWYKLLSRLEAELAQKEEKDALGNPIRLVDPNGDGTYFPLHALRVSLITGLIMEGGLPIEVVSKLIAGHHGLIQTIYYTKIGIDHMNKLMADAEHKMTENEARGHKTFLMRHGRDEINQRFASVSQDGVKAAMNQKSEAGFVFDDKGLCPVGCAMCDVGGEKISEAKDRKDYGPVPGYPHERNCIRCRFFLTGPAWLHALNAKFNHIAYQAMLAAERYNSFTEQVAAMEERRAECEATGRLFTEAVDLEKHSALLEAETQTLDRWITDLQAIQRLIHRCIEINKNAVRDGLQLVAAGTLFDIQAALTVTESELHPIEVQCRNATIYPEIDARQPAIRRSQLLDALLHANKKPLLFSRLSVEQQLLVGNATMKLIESRAGSLENAVEFVEAQGRLKELGIVDDDLVATLKSVGDQGVAMTQILRDLRSKKSLPAPMEEGV
jgi:hypothetical protein